MIIKLKHFLGSSIGSFIGGYPFKTFRSLNSFKLFPLINRVFLKPECKQNWIMTLMMLLKISAVLVI